VIDLTTEPLLMLSGCKRQAGIGKSYRSMHRYVRQGVRRGGRVVKLAVIQTPTGMATSLEAYRRFIAELTEANHD
jgi:hypothetical protein